MLTDMERSASASPPELEPGEVAVWFAELDQPDAVVQRLSETICPEEHQRAMRFRFEHDRRRFVVSRAILRNILAFYLEIEPQQVAFQYGQFGKPSLAGELEESGLQFSVSHSGSGALYGVAEGRRVGVDLEWMRPLGDMRNVAKDCFSVSENIALGNLPEREMLRGFYDGWTRKEAFLKATGCGLSLSPKACEVSLAPGAGWRELKVLESPHNQVLWMLISLTPHPQYSAAVVVEGPECRVRFAEWVVATHRNYLGGPGTNLGSFRPKGG
jgi:4'-phosphopantetheinyl transferase